MDKPICWKHILFRAIIPAVTFVGIVAFLVYTYHITPEVTRHEFFLNVSSSVASWAAAVVAYYGLMYAGDTLAKSSVIAKQQSTIDMVMDFNHDERLQRVLNDIFRDSSQLTLLYCELSKQSNGEALRDDYHYVLNRNEFVSLGIRRGAFDEQLYKYLYCSNTLKLWHAVAPLIFEIRKSSGIPTLYQELEWLCNRWTESPIQKIQVKT